MIHIYSFQFFVIQQKFVEDRQITLEVCTFMVNKLLNLVILMRPKHYIKNLLIFVPIIFSDKQKYFQDFKQLILGFCVFCLLSSAVYVMNDIKDMEQDRLHPIKKNRPIANGDITINEGWGTLCLLLFLCFILNFPLSMDNVLFWIVPVTYFIFNIIYSHGGKNYPILDIMLLSLGFVLRVYYGGILARVEVSSWLYFTTLSAALYLSVGKRRNEFLYKTEKMTRKSLSHYNKEFLDGSLQCCLTLTIIFYSLWAMSFDTKYPKSFVKVIYTVPLVITILFKYHLNIYSNLAFADPLEVIFSDKILIILIIFYSFIILNNVFNVNNVYI